MEKHIQFSVSWKDASKVMNKIKTSNMKYFVRQIEGRTSIAFVFPKVSVSQYVYLYILFGPKAAD